MEPSRYKDKLSTHVLGKKRRILGSKVEKGQGEDKTITDMVDMEHNPIIFLDAKTSEDKKETIV